ncbi:tyrosine-type recombinase/integrase [Mesorhizobium marinum]|uniref:Tyrosine-type recombinase/integrase n=1 Tax=Mesorhizobium marinum TaxID=3228790 RepID=A0ABV3R5G7_9HYPH
MPKLTKSVVDDSKPRDKQFTVWCSDLKGFGLFVNPKGTKTYFVDYRAGTTRRRMTIGRHGPLTTEEARKLAIKTLGSTVQGEDPQLERKTRRSSLTVSELCDSYFAAADKGLVIGRKGQPKKARTLSADNSMVEAHVKPLLGRKLVIDLRRADVVKFIRDVQSGKTAKAKEPSGKLRGRVRVSGGPGSAVRAVAALGTILSYAVGEGVIDINPTFGVKKPAAGKKDRRLTPDEYKAFGKVVETGLTSPSWQGPAMLKLAALTGCRIGEVENLQWSEVDLENSLLVLADSKTGKSVRPLGTPAKTLLARVHAHAREGNPYVFPAARLDDMPYAGVKRSYRGLFKAAGLDGVTPHVLRHSFASVGADLGFTDSTIGACLGHGGQGITSRYTHRLDSVLIAAADKIAGEVERQMGC